MGQNRGAAKTEAQRDYVNLLLQPGAADAQLGLLALATRDLSIQPVTRKVLRAFQNEEDPRLPFVELVRLQQRSDCEREVELEARIRELKDAVLVLERKLCQSNLEVKLLHDKSTEHARSRKKIPHAYQKSKAAAVVSQLTWMETGSAPFGKSDSVRNGVEFLELVRLLLAACTQDSELPEDGLGEVTPLIVTVGGQLLKHLIRDMNDRTDSLRNEIRQSRYDADHITVLLRSLTAGVGGIGPIALHIIADLPGCSGAREDLVVVFAGFIRDLVTGICLIGGILNDVAIIAQRAGQPNPRNTMRGCDDQQESDICRMLCDLVLELCRAQPVLVPGTMVVLAESCETLAKIMGRGNGRYAVLPSLFTNPDEEDFENGPTETGEAKASKSKKDWVTDLGRSEPEVAAASALAISYYLLDCLRRLLTSDDMNHDLQLEFMSENLARTCSSLLENSLVSTPTPYATLAFEVCMALQQILDVGTFDTRAKAVELVARCLATAGNASTWDRIGP
ncbi:hypothetical protein HKX48_003793 [Thoreauomyces humboldtii]|nr:hypothetical protein HKX48_003793 [Thoreauomyces humboldtii]